MAAWVIREKFTPFFSASSFNQAGNVIFVFTDRLSISFFTNHKYLTIDPGAKILVYQNVISRSIASNVSKRYLFMFSSAKVSRENDSERNQCGLRSSDMSYIIFDLEFNQDVSSLQNFDRKRSDHIAC